MPKNAIWARLPRLGPGERRDIRTIFFYEQLIPNHLQRQKENDLLANPLAASQRNADSIVRAESATSAASTQKNNNAQTKNTNIKNRNDRIFTQVSTQMLVL